MTRNLTHIQFVLFVLRTGVGISMDSEIATLRGRKRHNERQREREMDCIYSNIL